MDIIDKSKCIILGKYIFPRYELLIHGDELYAFNTDTQTLETYPRYEIADFLKREMIAEIAGKMLGGYFDLFYDKFLFVAENITETKFYEWEKQQIEELGINEEEFKQMIDFKQMI